MKEQLVVCDGKNIWTYIPDGKKSEVQLNYYEESDDVFSPSKIFSLYKEGYVYQIKEKKTVNGKDLTVLEMAPPNKKLTYFKIDITVDEASLQILESKIYEKNGTRYIYKLTKQTPNAATSAETFTFDTKKYPGVKVVDLR
jgi:outer membrane lipoprotein-sorting protein